MRSLVVLLPLVQDSCLCKWKKSMVLVDIVAVYRGLYLRNCKHKKSFY